MVPLTGDFGTWRNGQSKSYRFRDGTKPTCACDVDREGVKQDRKGGNLHLKRKDAELHIFLGTLQVDWA